MAVALLLQARDAVFRAYDELGIRANCSGHVIHKPFADTIPFTERFLTDELTAEMDALKADRGTSLYG